METKSILTPKKKDVNELQNELLLISSLVVAAITYIYCFPYIQFFSGLISSPTVCLLSIAVYMVIPFLLVACAVIIVSRIVIYWKQLKTVSKLALCVVALCSVGIIPISIGNKSYEPTYLHGFCARIQRRIDADAIREWIQEVELDADMRCFDVDLQKAPSFIKLLDPGSVRVEESIIGEDGRIGRLAFFNWPAVGGIRMVVTPQGSDSIELSLPDALHVAPGICMWNIPK